MRDVTIGGIRFRLVAAERHNEWIARAERDDTGDRFGPECAGSSEGDAMLRVERWLEWQHEHAEALDALMTAESAYQRTIAGSAFAGPTEGPSALEMQKESLEEVEAARVRLDEIRARKPGP